MTDQAMPGMTGTQLVAEIRASWPDLPVVIATGYPELPKGGQSQPAASQQALRPGDLAAMIARLMHARVKPTP
jgi:CheY-like chemotaxis protein